MTALAPPSWRLAWAERENERRRRAYRDATAAWHRRQDHLVRLRIEAAGFLGCTQPRTGLPVDLDDDEMVFRVVPVAELVEAEARHVTGLPTPGGCALTETVDAALPAGLRAVDGGMAVVTSHRVAFAGREHRREWRYADLLGVAHHPDVPVTLLHDTCRLSGLRVPAGAAVNFRFYLTLAASADRAAVTAQVDALLAAHRATPPGPPPPVDPADAPLSAVRPDRRALAVAAVATVVFAALGPGAVGPPQAGPMRRAEAATIEPTGRDAEVIAPLRTPTVLLAPPNPATPARPAEPARPPAAGPLRPAAPAAVAAAPLPTVAPVPSTAPVPVSAPAPVSVPVPLSEPVPTVEPMPSVTPGPSANVTPTPTPAPTDPATAARPVAAPPTPTAQATTATPDPATPPR